LSNEVFRGRLFDKERLVKARAAAEKRKGMENPEGFAHPFDGIQNN